MLSGVAKRSTKTRTRMLASTLPEHEPIFTLIDGYACTPNASLSPTVHFISDFYRTRHTTYHYAVVVTERNLHCIVPEIGNVLCATERERGRGIGELRHFLKNFGLEPIFLSHIGTKFRGIEEYQFHSTSLYGPKVVETETCEISTGALYKVGEETRKWNRE